MLGGALFGFLILSPILALALAGRAGLRFNHTQSFPVGIDWAVPKQPGRHILMARATDSQKRVQPLQRDDDRRDSMISHVQRIEVEGR